MSNREVVGRYQADLRGEVYGGPKSGPNWGRVAAGGVIAGIAATISLGSYDAASSGGGHYVVLWGAVLWGGWIALKGLIGSPE